MRIILIYNVIHFEQNSIIFKIDILNMIILIMVKFYYCCYDYCIPIIIIITESLS